jgi:pimeloyl-ACP methyl ester carboxylesterase
MATEGITQSSDKTLILISGAGHGAWSWEKVIPLLEAKGYSVLALELPGNGNDTAKLENNTFDHDVKAVIAAANAISGKIILLGHSSGGTIISQAAELLGTDKVDKLIYLDAFLPQNGESVFSIADKLGRRNQPSSVSNAPASERFIFSDNNTSFKWNPELVQELLYDDCSQPDIAFAKANLSWQSVATLATPVQLTDEVHGAINKYYILCTQSKDLDKSTLTSDVHCEKVYQLASSHSPFFSMPEKLVAILEDLY